MDNFQKALHLAAGVFLFVIAASVSIILYTGLIDNTKKIIIASDTNRNSAEYVTDSADIAREIKKDEIILTILNIENNKSYIKKLIVNDKNNTPHEFLSESEDGDDIKEANKNELEWWLGVDTNPLANYVSTYDDENMILTYNYNP